MNLKQLRPFLLTLFCAALVITGLTAIARAQSAPEAVSATAAQTSSSFTFQGQLQDGGIPVNATCDIQAGLWDAETNGAQVGSTQTVTDVAVVDGRFTITLNANSEFGPEAFTGQARWLQIAVRCPTGSGSYSTLQPRQPLTAAPYAQSLLPGAVISGSVGTLICCRSALPAQFRKGLVRLRSRAAHCDSDVNRSSVPFQTCGWAKTVASPFSAASATRFSSHSANGLSPFSSHASSGARLES